MADGTVGFVLFSVVFGRARVFGALDEWIWFSLLLEMLGRALLAECFRVGLMHPQRSTRGHAPATSKLADLMDKRRRNTQTENQDTLQHWEQQENTKTAETEAW
jgi:hypothetical protein